jgi:hypothetical protein
VAFPQYNSVNIIVLLRAPPDPAPFYYVEKEPVALFALILAREETGVKIDVNLELQIKLENRYNPHPNLLDLLR